MENHALHRDRYWKVKVLPSVKAGQWTWKDLAGRALRGLKDKMSGTDRRDWSEKDLKKHIVEQRKFLWRDSTIDRIASWLGLHRGITAVDVGCGLGYLGWTFWRHYGKDSCYIGVDCSEDLLMEAAQKSNEWSSGGRVDFVKGSAYSIPLPDECADWVMCQTLLMHLEFPRKALDEMLRVTKPGGVIMCMEPDNISSSMSLPFSSLCPMTVDERLWTFRMQLIWAEGRERLGRGDWGIGAKVPTMMADAGLTRIDVLYNDSPRFIHPPYETEVQSHSIEQIRESILDKDEDTSKLLWKRWRECFIAGGGSLSTFYRFRKFCEERRNKLEPLTLEQLDNSTYYGGVNGSHFYCIRGFKTGSSDG
jgi:ubiquinone/menaquinone biosynthesis C-methylase UbiE